MEHSITSLKPQTSVPFNSDIVNEMLNAIDTIDWTDPVSNWIELVET